MVNYLKQQFQNSSNKNPKVIVYKNLSRLINNLHEKSVIVDCANVCIYVAMKEYTVSQVQLEWGAWCDHPRQ
jgi:hypothetical protein